MSDRSYVTLLLAGCGVVIVALIWMALSLTSEPRSAHGTEIETVSNDRLDQLSERIDHLSTQLESGTLGAANGARPPAQPAPGEIIAAWIDRAVPLDPASPIWSEAPVSSVALVRQDQAMPMLETVVVPRIDVQALTDGMQIAWRLSWADASANYHLDTDLFCDAVALQFPIVPNANFKMGDRDFPVQIMQWKAIWQKDIDEHYQDVQDLHPNYWTDLYWFAEGEFPYPVPDAFQRTEALDWFVAYRANNPMADLYREQPVQEMIAEGFGTLTNQPDVATVARGAWADGRWSVVFSRPLRTNDLADFQFSPGERNVVAFAVWEGQAGNVSGRKQHSQWVVFEVQQ